MKAIGRAIATLGMCGVWIGIARSGAHAPFLGFFFIFPFIIAVAAIWGDGK